MAARVLLIGLPGSGKSTVGPLLAQRLDWPFLDVDAEIERRTGMSIAGLFHSGGETAFRDMELRLTAELSSLSPVVLATGGGWAAQPGALDALPAGSATVWLRVSPAEAIRRLRGSPVERPLLAVTDPLAALTALAGRREGSYARAGIAIDVDGRTATDIADDILAWLTGSTS
jgi:shikimate kinase